MKAVTIGKDHTTTVEEVPIPKLEDNRVLVKIKAVAINPTDWKAIHMRDLPGARSGCDYVGIVQEVGSKVGKTYNVGDRIAGMIKGANMCNFEDGAFAEYANAKPEVSMRVPDNLSDEEAATLGIAVTTVGQGLYKSLGLPLPTPGTKPQQQQQQQQPQQGEAILIWGGSTAMGVSGIQYAKASGLTVVATASPRNFDYVRSLGADAVFDYGSPTAAADIKAYTGNRLRYAWDCVGSGARPCAAALSDELPGKYGAIIPVDERALREANPRVEGPFWTLGYDALGEESRFGDMVRPAMPDELEFAKMFWELSRKLFASGTVKPIRVDVNRHGAGLDGVLRGLSDLKEGKVTAQKLVYTI